MSRARAAPGHRGTRVTSLGAGTERAHRLHVALPLMGQRPGSFRLDIMWACVLGVSREMQPPASGGCMMGTGDEAGSAAQSRLRPGRAGANTFIVHQLCMRSPWPPKHPSTLQVLGPTRRTQGSRQDLPDTTCLESHERGSGPGYQTRSCLTRSSPACQCSSRAAVDTSCGLTALSPAEPFPGWDQ